MALLPDVLLYSLHSDAFTQVFLREGFPKKVAVLLDFVQLRGGGPCPNFLSTFHKLYILGQFGDGEGGGDPCPNFLAHWRSKKVVQVVQIRGRGVEVIWTTSKRTATFFGRPSLSRPG